MLNNAVGRLRLVGMVEAVSFLLLLGVAMPLKYFAGIAMAVRIAGWIHGLLFIAFGICLLVAHSERRWPLRWIKTIGLFAATALAEILGCYLPYLWLRKGFAVWLLLPAAVSLTFFVWLLSLHPTAAGRVYAAYGGVYVTVAILWLWLVDAVRPTAWDWLGVTVCLSGMAIIMFSPRPV
jgi:small multidrug resistance family-3 protein